MTLAPRDPSTFDWPSPDSTEHSILARLVRDMGFEVMPFRSTEDAVLRHVPRDVPLSVTTTVAKGTAATVDLAVRLRDHGYDVAPHLAARQLTDDEDVARVVRRLRSAGVERVFVIGGDAPRPVGCLADAFDLLRSLDRVGHPFTDVGVGGYPEGHPDIPEETLDRALADKASYATRVVTQMCFDPAVTGAWATRAAARSALPVYVGMPGPVNRQKLIRISAAIGLGQSARFLQKQQGLWRFVLPGAYNPTRLVRRLGRVAVGAPSVCGLHIFTFNELERTERWRRSLRARVGLG